MNKINTLSIGDQVTLHYRLTCNGEVIVNTFADQPETFYIGGGDIDPRLESLLTGLQVGDHRTFELEPGAAFGSHQPGMVHDLPRADFTAGQALVPGHDVAFTLPNGQTLHGIIRSIDDAMVRVDFNHPLAGLAVEFEVKILAVDSNSKT
jgi:FKBP-type peptidyl-prolyl cis-trans isomerase SlpA